MPNSKSGYCVVDYRIMSFYFSYAYTWQGYFIVFSDNKKGFIENVKLVRLSIITIFESSI